MSQRHIRGLEAVPANETGRCGLLGALAHSYVPERSSLRLSFRDRHVQELDRISVTVPDDVNLHHARDHQAVKVRITRTVSGFSTQAGSVRIEQSRGLQAAILDDALG